MGITSRGILVPGLVAGLLLSGCGGGGKSSSAPPKPGTIGHAWLTAGETYKRGDYVRTMEHLSRVAANQNEYREKAKAWLLLVAGGVADGYIELANAYEIGSKINKTMGPEYRKRMTEARNIANTATMQFAEIAHELMEKNKEMKIAFDFGFPTGSASEPVQLAKVSKGFTIQPADNDVLSTAQAQRGVVRFAAAIGGAPEDPAKAAAQFANPARDAFLMALAEGLYKKADLYSNRKLDMPKRGNVLCKEALEALSMLPDSKEKKALEAKVKDELKKHKVES